MPFFKVTIEVVTTIEADHEPEARALAELKAVPSIAESEYVDELEIVGVEYMMEGRPICLN